MADTKARLDSFTVETGLSRFVEKTEIVGLAIMGFYLVNARNGSGALNTRLQILSVIRVRCAFCKRVLSYTLANEDATTRLIKLKRMHALQSHTCPITLDQLSDNKQLAIKDIQGLLDSLINEFPRTLSLNQLEANYNSSASSGILSALSENHNSKSEIDIDNYSYFENIASRNYEIYTHFNSIDTQEIFADESLPGKFTPKLSLVEIESGKNCNNF